MSASVGFGISLSNAAADMTCPDWQYPHCGTSTLTHAFFTASPAGVPNPSMVMISASCTDAIGVTHERRGRPFRCTVHAPHWATPQPYFVPVSLSSSRTTHSKGVSGSTSTLTFLPLTEKFVTGAPKGSRGGKHCGDGDFYSVRPCAAIARLENREHGQLRLKREG